MEYAIIESGGKQYKVSPGTIIEVDNLNQKEGSFIFDRVLLSVNGTDVKFGAPFIDGLSVAGKVLGSKRGEKIHVSKFKGKSRYRKTIGFRADLTSVEIVSIGASKKEQKASSK